MALYAFDGTWSDEKDAGEYARNTNVVRFKNAYDGARFFYKGLGTKHGLIGKIFGGAFGVGGQERTRAAMRDVGANWHKGDREIDIIGFSRGAAIALHFANVLLSEGVRDPDNRAVLDAQPSIRFLGLWDVVAAFGVPIDIGIQFSRINLGYRLDLPAQVTHAFHALALDERRQTFRPTRTSGACEVWFRGGHGDVGGGNANPGLNNISLCWMLRKAAAVGVPMTSGAIEAASTDIDPAAPVQIAKFDPLKNPPRAVAPTDRIHYTVQPRDKHNNPPPGAQVETVADEVGRPG